MKKHTSSSRKTRGLHASPLIRYHNQPRAFHKSLNRKWLAPSVGFAMVLFIASALCLPLRSSSAAAGKGISITSLGVALTENFDILVSSGTSSTVPTGWAFFESGASANTIYTAGTGSSNTGDTYSFGASGNSERAFGGLQSGNLIPTIGACYMNDTGSSIGELVISYTGEQWRLGTTGRGADRIAARGGRLRRIQRHRHV